MEENKMLSCVLVDPKRKGIINATVINGKMMPREKLRRLMQQPSNPLWPNEPNQLFFLRQLHSVILEVFSCTLSSIESLIGPLLLPAILEHKEIHHIPNRSRDGEVQTLNYSPEDIVKVLHEYNHQMQTCMVYEVVRQQFFEEVYHLINSHLLNSLIEREDLCRLQTGFLIKYSISPLHEWTLAASLPHPSRVRYLLTSSPYTTNDKYVFLKCVS